jgi:hypothetical protein
MADKELKNWETHHYILVIPDSLLLNGEHFMKLSNIENCINLINMQMREVILKWDVFTSKGTTLYTTVNISSFENITNLINVQICDIILKWTVCAQLQPLLYWYVNKSSKLIQQ